MIEDIGIDIISNERIKKSINDNFINQVLSKEERNIYKEKKGKHALEFICGRYAAKESIIKAISSFENPHMSEITIINLDNGKPIVKYKNYNIRISISHENDFTIAQAIILKH